MITRYHRARTAEAFEGRLEIFSSLKVGLNFTKNSYYWIALIAVGQGQKSRKGKGNIVITNEVEINQ